jgi:hypothetical protein
VKIGDVMDAERRHFENNLGGWNIYDTPQKNISAPAVLMTLLEVVPHTDSDDGRTFVIEAAVALCEAAQLDRWPELLEVTDQDDPQSIPSLVEGVDIETTDGDVLSHQVIAVGQFGTLSIGGVEYLASVTRYEVYA